MTLKKWFKNLRKKMAFKLRSFFLRIAYSFVEKENPEDPFVWFKANFKLDPEYIVKLMTMCDVGPFYGSKKVQMTDEQYKDFLEKERKESIKLHDMFKSRLVPHYNQDMVEKHNEVIKNFPGDFNLKALMKREEVEGEHLLRGMVRPTDIIPPKGRLIK